jgi:hypothetical protein
LYWHFATFTALVSALIIAVMPLQGPSS